MTASISIACPKCQSKLRLSAAPAPGKKLRCPKCQAVFSAPAAASTMEEDPYADDDPYVDRPRSSSRRGGRRRKRKSSIGLKVPLMIVGVVVLLGGVGLGIMLVVKNLPGDLSDTLDLSGLADDLGMGDRIDFTWMPPGTQRIISIRPRAEWNSAIAGQFRDPAEAAEKLAGFESRFGFAYTDVESLTFFENGSGTYVEVIELTRDIDPEVVASHVAGAEPVQHGTATYYRLTAEGGVTGLCFPNRHTTLVAPESIVHSVLDGTFTAGDPSAFSFIDGSSDRLAATTQIDQGLLWFSLNDHPMLQMLSGGARAFTSAHGDRIVALGGGIRLRSDAVYHHTLKFADDESAEQARAWLQERLDREREKTAESLASMDKKLVDAQQAERDRQERAASGENPFGGGNLKRVGDVEEEHRQAEYKQAALEASDVSRSGSVLTVVTTLSADDLAADERLRARTIQDDFPWILDGQGWAPETDAQTVPALSAAVAPAPETVPDPEMDTSPTGNEKRVFEFTYDIDRFAAPDIAGVQDRIETALLRVISYVPESARLDVPQARISFQVRNGFENQDALRELRRIGLVLKPTPVSEEQLLRDLPNQRTIPLELEIVSLRPGPGNRAEIAETMLTTVDGYVAGSLVIDEDARRLRAQFTRQPNINQVVILLRGGPRLIVRPVGRERSVESAGQVGPVHVSVYYRTYSGDGPVGEAVQRLAESFDGYVADSLEFDETAQYFTFEIETGNPRVDVRGALRTAGFPSTTFSTGSAPKPVEELKDPGGSERRSPGGR